MCTVCGCGPGETKVNGKAVEKDGKGQSHSHSRSHSHSHSQGHGDEHHHHDHSHAHDHHHHEGDLHHYGKGPAHAHAPGLSQARMVQIETDILSKNNQYAAANRNYFQTHDLFALNLVSSPGSGKTTLLTETIKGLKDEFSQYVIEGDQQTENDAARIRETGVKAIQINTGKGCHLDGHMVGHALEDLAPEDKSLVYIENVGNLVCPASFDLGEAHKVAILSVTEGEDKPIKYPDMFQAADVMVLTKTDLLPHLDFDMDKAIAYARRVNPKIQIVKCSAKSGEGMETWFEWIKTARKLFLMSAGEAKPALSNSSNPKQNQKEARSCA